MDKFMNEIISCSRMSYHLVHYKDFFFQTLIKLLQGYMYGPIILVNLSTYIISKRIFRLIYATEQWPYVFTNDIDFSLACCLQCIYPALFSGVLQIFLFHFSSASYNEICRIRNLFVHLLAYQERRTRVVFLSLPSLYLHLLDLLLVSHEHAP